VEFEGTAATTRRNGKTIVSGTGQYRPSTDVPAIAARYGCVADPKTGVVESVTYAIAGPDGAPAPKPPTAIVRDMRIVGRCRQAVVAKVWDAAIGQGLRENSTDAQLESDDATFTAKGTTMDVAGRGRIKLSRDYEWQPVTFTCRYDDKKNEATRASYAVDRTVAPPALSADKSRALDACQAAVEDQVLRDAQGRGYRALSRVSIDLKPGAAFTVVGQDRQLEVKGRGEYKLTPRHEASTPITFTCLYDPTDHLVKKATFEGGDPPRTASGEVATGKTSTLICESTSDVQRVCPARIKGSVTIIRQRGRTPCEAYKNWIWSPSGITVWGGCRAEFEFDTPDTPAR
jgi:hypothetical protein